MTIPQNLSLKELPFIDLYLRLDQPDQAYFRSTDRSKGSASLMVPQEFQLVIDRFASAINDVLKQDNDGSIDFEEVRCRLSRQYMTDNSVWACARRINTVIPDVEKLGVPSHILGHMQLLGRRDGLILVCGATGAGKTTTAVGLLSYYLRTYGGTALTVEDPVEYLLKGRHGNNGQCFQIEIRKDDDWALALKRSLRWAPRYIYVGEIRTPKAAEQLLRAASTGHLVITTVHAGAVEEALMGIIFLAEQAMGGGVHNMLAAGMTAIIHQTMRDTGPQIRYLWTEENAPGDPVRSLIRDNKIGMLSTYIDRAAARLAHPQGAASGLPKT